MITIRGTERRLVAFNIVLPPFTSSYLRAIDMHWLLSLVVLIILLRHLHGSLLVKRRVAHMLRREHGLRICHKWRATTPLQIRVSSIIVHISLSLRIVLMRTRGRWRRWVPFISGRLSIELPAQATSTSHYRPSDLISRITKILNNSKTASVNQETIVIAF